MRFYENPLAPLFVRNQNLKGVLFGKNKPPRPGRGARSEGGVFSENGGFPAARHGKFRFSRAPFIALLCVVLSSCVIDDSGNYFPAGGEDLCGFVVDPRTGQGIRWDLKDLPVAFYIHESVPEKAGQNFISAVGHWNQEWEEYTIERGEDSAPTLFSVVGSGNAFRGQVKNDSYNMLFFAETINSYGMKQSTQAVTKTYSLRRKIRDTDIIVNAESFQYYYDTGYDEAILAFKREQQTARRLASSQTPSLWWVLKSRLTGALKFFHRLFVKQKYRDIANLRSGRIPADRVDFASLMIHELGHVPGLGHSKGSDSSRGRSRSGRSGGRTGYSVMDPKLAYGQIRRNIGQYDLQNLFCGYYGK